MKTITEEEVMAAIAEESETNDPVIEKSMDSLMARMQKKQDGDEKALEDFSIKMQ